MKIRMRLTLVILLFFFLLNTSCKKDEPYMNDGIITGSYARMCICCGGLMINFDGETKPYIGDFKLIENSVDLGITEKDTFPIYVKVDWRVDTDKACKSIIITRLKRL